MRAALAILILASGLACQTGQQTKPPAQRPPGASPAAQIPPHTPPATAPHTVANLAAYEGQPVVAVEIAGRPDVDPEPLLAALPQKAGAPFQRTSIAASLNLLVSRLKAARPPLHVEGVAMEIRPEVQGIRVLFVLEPAVYIGVYQFPGALRFSYTRLLEAADYSNQQPYTASDIARAVDGLGRYFRQQGYFKAALHPELHVDHRHGLVDVLFHTSIGERGRFGNIALDGASPAQTTYLTATLGSFMARLRRASVIPGKFYSHSRLVNAAQRLQNALNSHGRLGAQVSFENSTYHPETNRADVRFKVTAGPKVKIQVRGLRLWPWNRAGLIPIYAESRIDPELIQEGEEDLVNHLAANGYFQARVTTSVTRVAPDGSVAHASSARSAQESALPPPPPPPPAAPPQSIAVTYTVAKGPQHDVEHVRFEGNTFFSPDDLLAQVTVQPEGWFWFQHGAFSQPLVRQSVQNLTALYQASGYSSVQITPVVTHPGGNLALMFKIVEGPQDFVNSLDFEGNTVDPGLLAPEGLNLGPGTPFSQTLINQDRAHILAYYLSHGYLNATFRAAAERVAGHAHEISVRYVIAEGPRVHTTSVVTVGRQLTQRRLIERHSQDLKPGALLTETDMLRAESQLYAPGIFDWAEVGPRRPITTQQQEDVVIKLHEARRHSLVYGFGFDVTNRGGSIPSGTVAVPGLPVVGLPSSFKTSQATFYGPSANLEYTLANLRGKAETLSLGGFAGRLDQHASITYTDPALFWSHFSGNLIASVEHDSRNPIFTSRIGQAGYQLELPLNSDETANLFLRYSFTQTGLTRLLIPALVPERDRHVRLSTLSATYLRDTRDNPLDAHKGFLESYELDYTPLLLGSSADFGRVITQTAYYRTVHGRAPNGMVWANSLRFGFDHAFASSFVPLSEKFFSGGGSTLRGFPLDGAGPQQAIPACGDPSNPATCSLLNVPVGGNALFILNTELRVPTPGLLPNLGAAVFYDGGNVFSHLGFNHLGADFTHTIGAGLRYQTAVGPIRIDLGHMLNAPPGIKSTQLFITLGQAF